ncbi:MAG: antirestriction protein ArdA [Muribaculaceae bacterium]
MITHDYVVLENPAVYVSTYSKYNNGSLSGRWIDLSTFDNYYDFVEYCYAIHKEEDDPELMFQSYENYPSQWYSECMLSEDTFDKIIQYSNANNQEVINAYMSCFGIDDFDDLEDKYCGAFDSTEDFARSLINECYCDLSDFCLNYFDYSSFAYDIFIGDYSYVDGYVFRNY